MAGVAGSGCGAPIGSKNALGNSGGAPRKYDRSEYALKLINWAEKDTSTNLVQFAGECQIPLEYISRWDKEDVMFSQALQIAKSLCIKRQYELLHQGKYEYRDYNRQLGLYNALVREFDREEKQFEANLNSKASENNRSTHDEEINYRIEIAKLKAENAILRGKVDESKTGTEPLSSEQTD